MIYAQGFYHLDSCHRAHTPVALCSCDLLKLQEATPAIPAPSKAEVLQVEEAPLVVDGIEES